MFSLLFYIRFFIRLAIAQATTKVKRIVGQELTYYGGVVNTPRRDILESLLSIGAFQMEASSLRALVSEAAGLLTKLN